MRCFTRPWLELLLPKLSGLLADRQEGGFVELRLVSCGVVEGLYGA